MPRYRVTIRYGRPRSQYLILELEADTMGEALSEAASSLSPEVSGAADLAEIRVLVEEDEREYV